MNKIETKDLISYIDVCNRVLSNDNDVSFTNREKIEQSIGGAVALMDLIIAVEVADVVSATPTQPEEAEEEELEDEELS